MARFNDRTLPHLRLPPQGPRFPAFPFHQPAPRPRRESAEVTWIVHEGLANQIRQHATPQLSECALHFLTQLAVQTRQRKDPDAYIALHSGVLRQLYTSRFYGPMMRLLRRFGAIECRANGRYIVGSSCRHYRLAKEFRAATAISDVSKSVVARARFIFRRASFKAATTRPLRWIIKSYLRCSFSAAVPEMLETHVFRSPASRLATLHTAGLVQRCDLEFHPDSQTGRVYYPVANLPKAFRRELLIDGGVTVEIDLAACQPTLLATLYPHPIRSDLAVWTASLQADAATLPEAQAKFARDLSRVREFLAARGIQGLALSPIAVKTLTASAKDDDEGVARPTVGYRLTQLMQISSADVDNIPRLAADSLSLLGSDVIFQTNEIQFIYTKAAEAKVAMVAQATQDARQRAEQIARQGGRAIKELHAAKSGVVQINPRYSTETSWEGNSDRSSLEKSISVTVSCEFSLR